MSDSSPTPPAVPPQIQQPRSGCLTALMAIAGIFMLLPGLCALLFGGIISVAAQVGDLFESLIKRDGGVKDSSHIIPGHGGVLDRVDSLLFVLPVAYLLLGWLPIPVLR